MSITLYEKFTGTDWNRYAKTAARVSCISSFAIAILSLLFGYSVLIGIWTICVGVVLSIWEFPIIFTCITSFEQIKELLTEKLYLKYEEAKVLLYFSLSIFCYFYSSLCIIAGLILDITAVLFIFAAINRRADAADGLSQNIDEELPYEPKVNTITSTAQSLLGASNKFGTF
eukprot:gene9174-12372_t